MNATPVAPALFEFLDRTHRDIMAQLVLLRPLVDAIEAQGLNTANRDQLRRTVRYFNTEARQHHLDEEKHIFPALLNSQNPEIVGTAQRLEQDHGWLEENWLQIAPSLDAAAHGNLWFDMQALRHALEVFEALYVDHITLEEAMAYPEAKKRLHALDSAGIGREMARRRALAMGDKTARAS